jgi:hypothetical protein
MVGTSNKSVPELAIERWTFWGWSELYKDMMKSVQRLFRLGVFIFRGNHGFSTSFWNSLPCLPWRKIRFQTTGVGETSCKFFLHVPSEPAGPWTTNRSIGKIDSGRAAQSENCWGLAECWHASVGFFVWKPLEEDGFATVRFTPQGIGQNYRPADGSKPIAQYSEINISNSQPFGAERHQGFDL